MFGNSDRSPYSGNVVDSLPSASSLGQFMVKVYGLLGISLLISAGAAVWGMGPGLRVFGGHPILMAIAMFGTLFALMGVQRIPVVNVLVMFFFAGLMGASLGPMLVGALRLQGGTTMVADSLLLTTAIFFSLSMYALVSRKSFSFLGSFLFTGLILVVILSLVQIFWHPMFLQAIVAGAGALVFSGLILFDTARILQSQEGEITPVMAVVTLYLDVLNLFISLLRLFELFRGEE